MSASKLIFGVVLGAGLATGSLYAVEHPEKMPWSKETSETPVLVEKSMIPKPVADAQARLNEATKANEEKQLAAVGEATQLPVSPPAVKDEVDEQIAKEEPSLAGREIGANARETMAAANSFKKRMEGDTTGNDNVDRLLKTIEKDEQVGAAHLPPAKVEERKPATATVIEMDGTTGATNTDVVTDEQRIMQMAIPESVRQEILKNYRRTGQLPNFASGN